MLIFVHGAGRHWTVVDVGACDGGDDMTGGCGCYAFRRCLCHVALIECNGMVELNPPACLSSSSCLFVPNSNILNGIPCTY